MTIMTKTLFSTALILLCVAGFTSCSKTSVTGEDGKELTLISPADQTITQGDTNKVLITIMRSKFTDKVDIDVSDLPSGVSLANGDRAIASDDNTVTITLVADKDAKVLKDHRVKVTANGPGDLEVFEFFKLTVKAKS